MRLFLHGLAWFCLVFAITIVVGMAGFSAVECVYAEVPHPLCYPEGDPIGYTLWLVAFALTIIAGICGAIINRRHD